MFTFHHLGIAVRDLEQAQPFYEEVLGYRLTAGPFEDPIQRVKVCFLEKAARGEVVELIAPGTEPSPIQEILKRGGGAYHTCYQVPNLDEAIDRCRRNKCLLVSGPVPAVAFEGRRIAWLHTPVRHLLELVEAG